MVSDKSLQTIDTNVWQEFNSSYSKACVKRTLSNRPNCFRANYRLMQVKVLQNASSAILSTSLGYNLSLRSLFCLFLSGRVTQGLLHFLCSDHCAIFLITPLDPRKV